MTARNPPAEPSQPHAPKNGAAEGDTDKDPALDLAAAALDLPEEQQAAYVAAHALNPEQAEAALGYLDAGAQADQFLGKLAQRAGLNDPPSDASNEPRPVPTQPFGAYTLTRLIGEGGMGAVYLAERNDQSFEQQVAIKTLPLGLQTATTQARFRQERQILARLNHPNIAQLIDGGVAADGTPYIAMEYVEGTRVDQYCDEHQLTLAKRLGLFLDICSGVEYAHQNLIVHRDLKPANILVNTQGNVKLLDFGIAKLLDDSGEDGLTKAASQPMTLRYASPEVLAGNAATTASDVYALGVLLFELLCGTSPYRAQTQRELQQRVRDGDLALPHTALSQTTQAQQDELAQRRGTQPALLRRALRGDLANILMATLRHNPQQRYGSVRQFAGDIEHCLANRPVSVKHASTGYVLGKFYRRNRLAVVASLVGIAGLVAVAVMATWYGLESSRQATVIAQERDRAEQIQEFLLSIFQNSSPNASKGKTVTAKELLDAGAARIDEELASQPEARADLKYTIASIYSQLGFNDVAQALVRTSLDQQASAFGTQNPRYAASLEQLSAFVEMQGRYPEALQVARDALALAEQLGDNQLVAVNAIRVARIVHLQGEYRAAKPLYERALAIQAAHFGKQSEQVATTLLHYGSLLQHLDQHQQAIQAQRQALATSSALFGRLHTLTMSAYVNLGSALADTDDLVGATTTLREALAISQELLGADHPDNSYPLGHLSRAQLSLQDYEAAVQSAEQALALVAKHRGEAHPDFGILKRNIGQIRFEQGQLDAAYRYFTQARTVIAAAIPDGQIYWDLGRRLAAVERARGNLPEAAQLIGGSVEALNEQLGDASPRTQQALQEAVQIFKALGDDAKQQQYQRLLANQVP